MRICIVTREYPPITSYTGGIGTQFATMVPALVELGHEVGVVTFGEGRERAIEHDGAQFVLVPRARARNVIPLSDTRWSFRARRAIRRMEPFDIVFAREWGGDAWAYALGESRGPLVTKLATSIRHLATIGGEPATRLRLRARYRLQEWREREQTEHSSAVIAPTHAVLVSTAAMWRIDALPTAVIPNLFDLRRIRGLAAAQASSPVPDDGPQVFFFGRLQPLKGADVLVAAMTRVWREVPDARCVLAGHDVVIEGVPMSERLLAAAGSFRDRLHLLGPLPPDRLFPAVAAADVVALPSRWEAFGNVGVEAMALARPVVLTRCGGFEELCTNETDGLLVDAGDEYGLAGALLRLLGDAELRARLGAAAATRADEYDVGRIVPRHVEFFESLLGGS